MRTVLTAALAVAAFSSGALAQYTVVPFPATQWGAADAGFGISGAAIEDFEDANLIPGLLLSVASGSGSYGPTATLPNLMVSGPDAFGTAFVGSAWDGEHVLVNTFSNQALPYANAANWGNVRFDLPAGTTGVGFSLQQVEIGQDQILINGVNFGAVSSFLGLQTSSGRNGYFVIRTESGTISSLEIRSSGGDGFTIDHLAIIPAPGALALGLIGAASCARRRRMR